VIARAGRRRQRLGITAGIAAVFVVGVSAIGVVAGRDPIQMVVETAPVSTAVDGVYPADAVGQLEGIVGSMIATDGAFVVAVIDLTKGFDREPRQGLRYSVTYPVSGDVRVLWAPTEAAARAAREIEEVRVILNDEREAWLVDHIDAEGNVVMMVPGDDSQSTFLSPAVVDVAVPSDGRSGTFILSGIMWELVDMPLTVVDHCNPGDLEVQATTQADAVVEHIEAIMAARAFRAEQGALERTADRLSSRLTSEDPVTGIVVDADVNDLLRQLEAGVDASDVVAKQVVPMVVDLTTYDGEPGFAIFESESGEYLGWMGIGRADELFVAELRVPSDGTAIVVSYSVTPPSNCGGLPDDRVVMATIPYAKAAGTDRRALVDLASGTITALTAEDFRSLVPDPS
jgi:hypothetical protein